MLRCWPLRGSVWMVGFDGAGPNLSSRCKSGACGDAASTPASGPAGNLNWDVEPTDQLPRTEHGDAVKSDEVAQSAVVHETILYNSSLTFYSALPVDEVRTRLKSHMVGKYTGGLLLVAGAKLELFGKLRGQHLRLERPHAGNYSAPMLVGTLAAADDGARRSPPRSATAPAGHGCVILAASRTSSTSCRQLVASPSSSAQTTSSP